MGWTWITGVWAEWPVLRSLCVSGGTELFPQFKNCSLSKCEHIWTFWNTRTWSLLSLVRRRLHFNGMNRFLRTSWEIRMVFTLLPSVQWGCWDKINLNNNNSSSHDMDLFDIFAVSYVYNSEFNSCVCFSWARMYVRTRKMTPSLHTDLNLFIQTNGAAVVALAYLLVYWSRLLVSN
jgi:hypothetical protein